MDKKRHTKLRRGRNSFSALKSSINDLLFAAEPAIRNRIPNFEGLSRKMLREMKSLLIEILTFPKFDQRCIARIDAHAFALTKKYEFCSLRLSYLDFLDYALLKTENLELRKKFKKILLRLHKLNEAKKRCKSPKREKRKIYPLEHFDRQLLCAV